MSKRERIKAVLAGKPVDRVPVCFWRHFPGDDQQAESLAAVTLDFQRRYDLDFIKVPVSSTYCVSDYGVKHEYRGSPNGDREYTQRVVKKPEDWNNIEPLEVRKGAYGEMLKALRIIIEKKEQNTPVIFTIFDPLAMACYLSGEEVFIVHVRREPERVENALKALTETCVNFVREVIKEGADGIFLSARWASYEIVSGDEYRKYGMPGDLAALSSASSGWFNVLHIHGQHPMFKLLASLPAQAVNWHDHTAYPNLAEANLLFKGALMGGV